MGKMLIKRYGKHNYRSIQIYIFRDDWTICLSNVDKSDVLPVSTEGRTIPKDIYIPMGKTTDASPIDFPLPRFLFLFY